VRLVGAGGEDAPLRMAALRLISNTVCSARAPICSECPLSKHCKRKSDASGVSMTTKGDGESEVKKRGDRKQTSA
jgi:DNA (cytosine-5)-methyltransferase 1